VSGARKNLSVSKAVVAGKLEAWSVTEAVAVIGGGISGVQAALDLAAAGVKVHIIERSPSLGGRMAQLDKTFPTNDCSACILSPKLVEAYRHPLINVWTMAEARGLKGEAPDLRLSVGVRPRYVNEERCVGCGECARTCPIKVESEFDMGLGERKAIYTPFAQAVPLKYAIDPLYCLRITRDRCGLCEEVCPADAIDYTMEAREEEIEVGAVVVATGFDQYDPHELGQYRYGETPDVVTALGFERLLSPSGPTGGKLVRSDGSIPRRIVFVQCAGSRDINHCPYCSRFCCMASLKEAMIALEHEPQVESITICYIDLRTYGKDFDRYGERAREKGIALLKGKVSEVVHDPLAVRVEDIESGENREIAADMVVLAMAAVPSSGTDELAEILGIEVGDDGFFKPLVSGEGALLTSRRGVFLAGCCVGPKDIPDSVCEASAAASLALTMFPGRKPVTVRKAKLRDVSMEEPKVGVFVCRCGTNIASVVDVPRVVESALTMRGVAHAEENMFTCSEGALEDIAKRIEEKGLNRVVIASCTPRTHEPLFRDTLRKAGLNPYLLEMANIRDQCSWVHVDAPEKATQKSIELVESAVAKAVLLQPLEPERAEVVRAAVVIGGGPAGLSAARDISAQGYEVHLLESEEELGGLLPMIRPSIVNALLDSLKDSIRDARIRKGVRIESISGSVGDFKVSLEGGDDIRAGAIILAPGGEIAPHPRLENTITSLELEELLEGGELPRRVTFIQCVGVRNGEFGCSRFCCRRTLEQSSELASRGVEVSVLHRDIMAFQRDGEDLYRRASRLGVRFYRTLSAPEIGDTVRFESMTDGEIHLPADLVVLAVGMVPSRSNKELSLHLKVPLNQEGFFLEKHPKLAPVEFAVDGVFVAGGAQYPKDLEDAMIQGSAAAAKAAGILSHKALTTPAQICVVDSERCRGCGECERLCNYGAVALSEVGGRLVSRIEAKMCKGCGLCAVSCPSNAIEARGFTVEQLDSQISAILGGEI